MLDLLTVSRGTWPTKEWIQPPTPEPMARPLAVGFLGAQPEPMGIRVQQKEPEIDPVSGLEVSAP